MNLQESFDAKWEYRAPWTCKFWIAARHVSRGKPGYAAFSIGGHKAMVAHRWAWIQKNGPVPDGLVLDHFVCDNKGCVNDEHVRPTTQRENILRGGSRGSWKAAQTHCHKWHEFNKKNTYIRKDGMRQCRPCNTESARRRRLAKSLGL